MRFIGVINWIHDHPVEAALIFYIVIPSWIAQAHYAWAKNRPE